MQRYFINEDQVKIRQVVQLTEDDARHLSKVMRAQPGDPIEIVSLDGRVYLGQLGPNPSQGQVEILKLLDLQPSELPCQVTIAAGLSKNDKLDWIVQKATELGMSQFIPLNLKRNVVQWDHKKQAQKVERLQKIAQAACQQSKRLIIPTVQPLHDLEDLIQASASYQHKWLAYEETAKEGQHSLLKKELNKVQDNDKILVVFGPEGGLDEKEVHILVQAGFMAMSLGPRILRAETAPAYLLAAVSYQLEL